jgi:hypothetical protein
MTSLRDLLPARLAGRLLHLAAQVGEELVDVELLQELANGLGPHARPERVESVFLEQLPVARLGHELALLQRGRARVDDDVGLEIEDLLELLQRHVEQGADARG